MRMLKRIIMDSFIVNDEKSGQVMKEVVRGQTFEVAPRYIRLKYIDHGAYGIVCSASDSLDNKFVAIKKITPFDHRTYCQRTYREIIMLTSFEHENIIDLKNIICNENEECLKDIYLVTSLMETSLANIITSQRLTQQHICYFSYQILRGVKYIHSANVLHRDLKPSNILLNSQCDLKICDFGLARIAVPHVDHKGLLTEYVATRWYRAPEVILDSNNYDKSIDIWSVGCIMAEMIGSKPIFPGKHYVDQITCTLRVLGSPSSYDMSYIVNDTAIEFLNNLQHYPKKSWDEVLPGILPAQKDLIDKLLVFRPSDRYTAEGALKHYYFYDYHEDTDEPYFLAPFDFDMEHDNLAIEELKELIYRQIRQFKTRKGIT